MLFLIFLMGAYIFRDAHMAVAILHEAGGADIVPCYPLGYACVNMGVLFKSRVGRAVALMIACSNQSAQTRVE